MNISISNKVLVITDDDDSKIVRNLLKKKIFPLTRSSILSTVDLLKHVEIKTIVLDKTHKYVDTLEFILNVRDINNELLILLPKQYKEYFKWKTLKKFNNVEIYNNDEDLLYNRLNAVCRNNI